MTGSGSTVFGIFPKDATPAFSFPAHYFVKIV
jgi:4-diphosphocytidyl-2C-methyl-D-erythritol kinase